MFPILLKAFGVFVEALKKDHMFLARMIEEEEKTLEEKEINQIIRAYSRKHGQKNTIAKVNNL